MHTISKRLSPLAWLITLMLLTGGFTVATAAPASHARLQTQGAGVFERSPADWEEAGFVAENQDGDTIEFSASEGTYIVRFDGDTTAVVELVLAGGGDSVADVEETYVAPLLPAGSRFVDEFTNVLPGTGDYVTVVLFTSDSLYQQTSSRSGVILVTYMGSSASSIDRVSISIGS